MEVISIDSSDDDDEVPEVRAKSTLDAFRGKHGIASRDVTQDTTHSDDGSVSSADSIWDKAGLSSMPTSCGAAASGRLDSRRAAIKGADNAADDAVNEDEARHLREPDDETTKSAGYENPTPTCTVDAWIGKWKVMLLMDFREFSDKSGKTDFLQVVENKVNRHFGDVHCEKLHLPSADYIYVARLISNATGEVIDERVFDLIIERKDLNDLQNCLTIPSKSYTSKYQEYKPLSFFEAQMYKLQHCGVSKKLFLMEGDEDDPTYFSMYSANTGVSTHIEQEKRLKRVKTIRLQVDRGEFQGIDLICTKNKHDSVKFLIQQLERFKKSFDPLRPPTMTMEQLKTRINAQMNLPTFREYLRLRTTPGIGDVKAMKIIMDPKLEWDKSFVSPSCKSKETKSSLEDRVAAFWGESVAEAAARNLANARAYATRSKRSNGVYADMNKDEDPSCGLCRKAIDIWTETGLSTCNRYAKCGKVFHQSCLATQGYDIEKYDGCIVCRSLGKFCINDPKLASSAKLSNKEDVSSSVKPHVRSRTPTRQNGSKRPPEQLYIKRPIDKQQPATNIIQRTSYDRNGCLSNPLHNVDTSVAAALLLNEELPRCASNGGALVSAKRKRDATSICDRRVDENKTRLKSNSCAPAKKEENDVIVID